MQKQTIAAVAAAVFQVPIPPSLAVHACDAVGTAVKKI